MKATYVDYMLDRTIVVSVELYALKRKLITKTQSINREGLKNLQVVMPSC